jgi:hypothetical protein
MTIFKTKRVSDPSRITLTTTPPTTFTTFTTAMIMFEMIVISQLNFVLYCVEQILDEEHLLSVYVFQLFGSYNNK